MKRTGRSTLSEANSSKLLIPASPSASTYAKSQPLCRSFLNVSSETPILSWNVSNRSPQGKTATVGERSASTSRSPSGQLLGFSWTLPSTTCVWLSCGGWGCSQEQAGSPVRCALGLSLSRAHPVAPRPRTWSGWAPLPRLGKSRSLPACPRSADTLLTPPRSATS